ncbi:hypothetical protein [Leucobacter sp.]
MRAEHQDPVIPEDVQAKDLHPAARNELKTLQVDIQDRVARHLAMVALLIDDDVELAHQHALSASRRAGRIPVTRETLAITAYRMGDFALALRELRTYRRLSGQDGHVALMVDCERGLGRPEKAIETGLEVDKARLDTEQRVHLAIAMSGARLDLGQTQQALFELEIPELNPKKAFSWSPDLFAAYAAVLEDLGRESDARTWQQHANRAAAALQDHLGALDELEVFEIHESRADVDDEQDPDEPGTGEPITDESVADEPGAEEHDADERHEADEAGADSDADQGDADREGADQEGADQDRIDEDRADDEHAAADEPVAPEPVDAAPASFEAEVAAEVDQLLAEAGIVEAGPGEDPDDEATGKDA